MSLIKNNALVGASGATGYMLQRSLRFRSSASAYLNRTPASAGNRKTWTWSAWVKRGQFGAEQHLLIAGTSATDRMQIAFNSSDKLIVYHQDASGNDLYLQTSAVYRDPSAWYHVIVALDTTQAVASNKCKLYVNSVQVTDFTTNTNTVTTNEELNINNATPHAIGVRNYASINYFDGYLTDINLIDGQALDPTYFGETDATTGVWKPISYSGTYGTNGFYLNFSDNTSTTTLGYDTSGNGNNWTANNISVTSGATYDSMTDVPTLTSTDAANYATLNPTFAMSGVTTGATIIDGNLKKTTGTDANAVSSFALSAGSWYWEISIENVAPGNIYCGLLDIDSATFTQWRHTGATSGTTSTPTIATYTLGDTLSFAYDADNNRIYYAKNGVWQNSADPSAGSGFLTPNTSVAKYPFGRSQATQYLAFNFGQRPFAYTPPAGFNSLNTYNLPDSTIVDGSQYFDAYLNTGSGTSRTDVISFQPDFVWTKSRSATGFNIIQDSVRGAGNRLITDGTYAEDYNATYGSFTSTGFTFGSNTNTNSSGVTYVDWFWKANGSGVSNTDGSITSTVSANTTAGFSIVTYAGNGTDNATIGHGLGAAPRMLIWKPRNATTDWMVWHAGLSGYNYDVRLNTNAAQGTGANPLNNTAPSSSVVTLRNQGDVNGVGKDIVCYAFAEVEGYSKFGSYTGNGSADGPFVYTGFRPAFVMVKRADGVTNWVLHDSERDPENPNGLQLYPNLSNAEAGTASGEVFDFLSNGFKLRLSGGEINVSSGTYIYAAFAENPFKNALAR